MIAVSSACVAIAMADKAGSLRLVERESRFGLDGTFVAICDDRGTIEVADTMSEAESRIAAVRERLAA